MEDKYVKLTHHNGINRGFQFKEGLNTDIYELNEDIECGKGGLYFCKFKDVGKWIYELGKDVLIWDVEIPKGEKVIEFPDKLKAKSIILSNPKKAYDNYEICLQAVKYTAGMCIEFIENQTEEICKLAVMQIGNTIKYVKEQTPEICFLAIKRDGNALMYVKEQTPEICILAVLQNKKAMKYVKEKTQEFYEGILIRKKFYKTDEDY